LLGVKNAATNQFIWQTSDYNEMGQVQFVTLRNGHKITYTYDNMSMPQSMSYFKNMTNQMQLKFRFNYNFDQLTGNLLSRSDFLRNFEETFDYDNLMRLSESIIQTDVNTESFLVEYDILGNIREKADIGTYDYDPVKVHAVSEVVPFDQINLMWPNNQLIDYNANGKATKIEEGDYELNITYGYDNQRRKSVMTNNGQPVYTRYYLGKYEIEVTPTGTKQICYIPGPAGNIAVQITENSTSSLYYTLTDHLGSITAIVNEQGNIVEEQSFDPWGRIRNPNTWEYDNAQPISLLFRGYTGHEMLPEFGLVNMNGRMYDPVLGRMLSPDNYVQDPFFPQNYNRYAYCWNNPLKYTDPTGDFIWAIAAFIVVGGYDLLTNNWQGWEGSGKKAVMAGLNSLASGFYKNNFLYQPIPGNDLKNILYEVLHSTARHASIGLTSDAMKTIVYGEPSHMWKNTKKGAIYGAELGSARNLLMGPAYIPDAETYGEFDPEYKAVFRKGSFLTPKGSGGAFGRHLLIKREGHVDYDRFVMNHEHIHLEDMKEMGYFKFYLRTVYQYLINPGFRDVYITKNTLEYNAEYGAFLKLGYYIFYDYINNKYIKLDYFPY